MWSIDRHQIKGKNVKMFSSFKWKENSLIVFITIPPHRRNTCVLLFYFAALPAPKPPLRRPLSSTAPTLNVMARISANEFYSLLWGMDIHVHCLTWNCNNWKFECNRVLIPLFRLYSEWSIKHVYWENTECSVLVDCGEEPGTVWEGDCRSLLSWQC